METLQALIPVAIATEELAPLLLRIACNEQQGKPLEMFHPDTVANTSGYPYNRRTPKTPSNCNGLHEV